MKKRVLAILMLLLLLASGCVAKRVSTPELLGASDEELVSARGEGKKVSYDIGGESVTQQRKYQEELFNMSAQVEYLFGDDGYVSQIVATFPEVGEEELVNAISYHLDTSPIEVQNQSEELDFMARWEKDGVAYISRRVPASSLYVLMEKSK